MFFLDNYIPNQKGREEMIKKWKKSPLYKEVIKVKMDLKNARTKLSKATLTETEKKETEKKIQAAEQQEKKLWDEFLQSPYVFFDPNDRNHGYDDYKSVEPHLWPQVAGAHHYNFESDETKQSIDQLYARIAEEEGTTYNILFVTYMVISIGRLFSYSESSIQPVLLMSIFFLRLYHLANLQQKRCQSMNRRTNIGSVLIQNVLSLAVTLPGTKRRERGFVKLVA